MLSHMFRLFFELHTLYITVASHFQYHTTALCYCLFYCAQRTVDTVNRGEGK